MLSLRLCSPKIAVFFRFAAALIVVVLISVIGVALEKQTLETHRAVSRQYYQKDLLLEIHAKLRLKIQRQTAPAQLAELDSHSTFAATNQKRPSGITESRESADGSSVPVARLPLLRWSHPAGAEASGE